ncbi:hypothetical protein CHUAL_005251 [Chamberlinius hualienensis]
MASVPVSRTLPISGTRSGSTNLNGSYVNSSTAMCHPAGATEAGILFCLAIMGMAANILLMFLILSKKHLRSWSQGLLFHQGFVDCARAAILIPLGISVLLCQNLRRCSVLETMFVLLVSVSTINMLTSVLNHSPIIPDEEKDPLPLLVDSPYCVLFGMGMIWFAGLTINLGPTFLTGALAVSQDLLDTCPLINNQPMRHYVLNILWIVVNLLCISLTGYHLRKLHLDLTKPDLEVDRAASLVTAMVSIQGNETGICESHRVRSFIHQFEREGIKRVKMFVITTMAYVIFWCPLFVVTVADPSAKNFGLAYEITLHVAFCHAFVNPTLLLVLHKDLRKAASDLFCCYCCIFKWNGRPIFIRDRNYMEEGISPCQHYQCTVNRNYM